MPISLNISEHGNTLHRVSLGDSNYNLRVYWNTRNKVWELDVEFSDGTNIAKGITIIPEVSLLEPYEYSGFSGALLVFNLKSDGVTTMAFDNFGFNKSFELLWFSEEELSASS